MFLSLIRQFVCLMAIILVTNLSASVTVADDDLIIAPKELPKYRISNFKKTSDRFGRPGLSFDYKRTSAGEGHRSVHLNGKTDKGPISVSGGGVTDESGTFRISTLFGTSSNFEIYLTVTGSNGKKYLVSNVLRLGNPGKATRARALNAEEIKEIERQKQFRTPPDSLPAGHVAVNASTKLIPGMPVKAGFYGEWKDAEVVSFEVGGNVWMLYEGEKSLRDYPREKWIAISTETTEAAKSNPDQFKTSIRALPNRNKIIPDGAVPLADDVELLPGTPLLLDYYRPVWQKVYAIETTGEKVKLRFDKYSATWDKLYPRAQLVIAEETLEQLAEKDQEKLTETFAKNLSSGGASGGSTAFPGDKQITHKKYPVSIAVPKGAQFVPDDLTIEEGTELAACWGSKWRPLTAIHENEDGSLHVHWDEYSDSWNCNMTRDQLIIRDKTVRKLKRKTKDTTDDLKKTLRTWTDVTGKHKVEAWYVNRTEDQLILKTDAGREIKMPLEKLSEKDRALLPAVADESDNPFE